MRSRLSRSFYTSHCGGDGKKNQKNESCIVQITHPPTVLEDKTNGTYDGDLPTAAGGTPNSATTSVTSKLDKHKKRSKLCLILWPKFFGN